MVGKVVCLRNMREEEKDLEVILQAMDGEDTRVMDAEEKCKWK